jgi:hypothetical protein
MLVLAQDTGRPPPVKHRRPTLSDLLPNVLLCFTRPTSILLLSSMKSEYVAPLGHHRPGKFHKRFGRRC